MASCCCLSPSSSLPGCIVGESAIVLFLKERGEKERGKEKDKEEERRGKREKWRRRRRGGERLIGLWRTLWRQPIRSFFFSLFPCFERVAGALDVALVLSRQTRKTERGRKARGICGASKERGRHSKRFSPTHRVLAGARSSRSFAISAQSREGERGRGRGRGARGEEQGRKRHEEENKKQEKNRREGRTEGLEEKKRKLLQVSCWLARSLSLSPPLSPSVSLPLTLFLAHPVGTDRVRARPARSSISSRARSPFLIKRQVGDGSVKGEERRF